MTLLNLTTLTTHTKGGMGVKSMSYIFRNAKNEYIKHYTI